MDPTWMITWATYGTRLRKDLHIFPGDPREDAGSPPTYHLPSHPSAHLPGLEAHSQTVRQSESLELGLLQAAVTLAQLHQITHFRNWHLLGLAVLPHHVHVVVRVFEELDPRLIQQELKSYTSRQLTRQFGKPIGKTWWSIGGTRRKLLTPAQARAAIQFIREIHEPLMVEWVALDAVGRDD